ncbi:MAG: DUF1015 domain-containing protein [Dehalococcoidales bacterium]|nr:DUF1015 domain-containing protein [Dehalococcoidales bacterium]
MADIRPFHGVHYNTALVKDLARVICPPYDIIPPQLQQQLYQCSEYNFIRIEFGKELPQDSATDNRYTRAAAVLAKWLHDGILVTDETPSLYVADHFFTHKGKPMRRRSLYCLVKLEEWDRMVVRPHEGTLSRPKDDRLNLLWALKANTSPIMGLYQDTEGDLAGMLDRQARGRTLLEVHRDPAGEDRKLWAITDKTAIEAIRSCLERLPIYIADGHHRYESALNYRRSRRASSPGETGEMPFDFVLMALVDIDDPGLVILPAHRLIRSTPAISAEHLIEKLVPFFRIDELPVPAENTVEQIDRFLEKTDGEIKLLLYGARKGGLLRLTLRDHSAVRQMMPYFHTELYQKLDVSVVDHVILEGLLGFTHEMVGAFIDYTNDCLEAIRKVDEQEFQFAIIVSPVKPSVVKDIADSGDRMPRKSTYFYPKIPAGLVFYRFS